MVVASYWTRERSTGPLTNHKEWEFVRKGNTCASPASSARGSESDDNSENDHATPLPTSVAQFFASVPTTGYPEHEIEEKKAQPWKRVWKGPQKPERDGSLVVACPKRSDFGSNGLGGY